jgi:transcriptional regulator with XRE-family HTH domain
MFYRLLDNQKPMTQRIPKDLLRQKRREHGFTQTETTRLLGFKSRSQLSRVERGYGAMRLEQAMRAWMLFDLPIERIAPSEFAKAKNGLWEEIDVLESGCRNARDVLAEHKLMFLKKAEAKVEALDSLSDNTHAEAKE